MDALPPSISQVVTFEQKSTTADGCLLVKKSTPVLHKGNKRKPFKSHPTGKKPVEDYELECGDVLGGIGAIPEFVRAEPFQSIPKETTLEPENKTPTFLSQSDSPEPYCYCGSSWGYGSGGGYAYSGGSYYSGGSTGGGGWSVSPVPELPVWTYLTVCLAFLTGVKEWKKTRKSLK